MKGIDLKSALIGLLLGVCLLLVLGAAGKEAKSNEDNGVGRYRIDAVGYPSSNCFVIDSKTGVMWLLRSDNKVVYIGSVQEWEQR
ncbi:MAG: hypothetical protein ACYS8Z_14955 [Planctomycetota bacterium]|jgi:hypothetical protein